jgi:hypothetical protein
VVLHCRDDRSGDEPPVEHDLRVTKVENREALSDQQSIASSIASRHLSIVELGTICFHHNVALDEEIDPSDVGKRDLTSHLETESDDDFTDDRLQSGRRFGIVMVKRVTERARQTGDSPKIIGSDNAQANRAVDRRAKGDFVEAGRRLYQGIHRCHVRVGRT